MEGFDGRLEEEEEEEWNDAEMAEVEVKTETEDDEEEGRTGRGGLEASTKRWEGLPMLI